MGLRVSGKRALIWLASPTTVFEASGVSTDGRARANVFEFQIGGTVVEANGYNQPYTEPVPVGQNAASGTLTTFYNNAAGEANAFLEAMRLAQHEVADCADVDAYELVIMPEGGCVGKEKWHFVNVVLENRELPIPMDDLLLYTTPFKAGAGTRSIITGNPVALTQTPVAWYELEYDTAPDSLAQTFTLTAPAYLSGVRIYHKCNVNPAPATLVVLLRVCAVDDNGLPDTGTVYATAYGQVDYSTGAWEFKTGDPDNGDFATAIWLPSGMYALVVNAVAGIESGAFFWAYPTPGTTDYYTGGMAYQWNGAAWVAASAGNIKDFLFKFNGY